MFTTQQQDQQTLFPHLYKLNVENLPDTLGMIDLFAGAGGASLGYELATNKEVDIALNHDAEAIAVHQANHPTTKHLLENIWDVDPRIVLGGRNLRCLWASPDCKGYSRANSGPKEAAPRSLPWAVVLWVMYTRPEILFLENVIEFEQWTDLINGRNNPKTLGKYFKIFIQRLAFYGYKVEVRRLRAHHFGAATSRERLFLVARRDGKKISWPEPTHSENFRSAASIIDWSDLGKSIFERKTDLVHASKVRVAKGLKKFILDHPSPFIAPREGVANFISSYYSARDKTPGQILHEPLKTISTKDRFALVTAFISSCYNATKATSGRVVTEPLPTQTGGNRFALVSAFVSSYYGRKNEHEARGRHLDEPLPTQPTSNRFALVSTFIEKTYGTKPEKMPSGISVEDTLDTITAKDHHRMVTVHLEKGLDHREEVKAFLQTYAGCSNIITLNGEGFIITDITLRMLKPEELARAQGFPEDHLTALEINGEPLTNDARVRLIGNSVVPQVAEALIRVNLGGT